MTHEPWFGGILFCIWHSILPVRDTYFLLPAARDMLEMLPLFNHEAPDMKNIILKDEGSLHTCLRF
jgi:hypothetical protein